MHTKKEKIVNALSFGGTMRVSFEGASCVHVEPFVPDRGTERGDLVRCSKRGA